jgi:hypothetical protein
MSAWNKQHAAPAIQIKVEKVTSGSAALRGVLSQSTYAVAAATIARFRCARVEESTLPLCSS